MNTNFFFFLNYNPNSIQEFQQWTSNWQDRDMLQTEKHANVDTKTKTEME